MLISFACCFNNSFVFLKIDYDLVILILFVFGFIIK